MTYAVLNAYSYDMDTIVLTKKSYAQRSRAGSPQITAISSSPPPVVSSEKVTKIVIFFMIVHSTFHLSKKSKKHFVILYYGVY